MPANVNITIPRGEEFIRAFYVRSSSGVDLNLSAITFRLLVLDGASTVIDQSVTGSASGKVVFSLTAAQTSALNLGSYSYSIKRAGIDIVIGTATVIRSQWVVSLDDGNILRGLQESIRTAPLESIEAHTHSAADVTSGTLAVARGGTGTSTAFTQGSVAFAGTSGVYTQDNTRFFWDNTNKRLIVGGNTGYTAKYNALLGSTSEKGVVIRGVASQTGTFFEGQNNAGSANISLGANGSSIFRSNVTGSNGSVEFATGVNPILSLKGDTTNGYYPELAFHWVGGTKTCSLTGYGGLTVSPQAGFAAGCWSYYQNAVPWYVKSGYVGNHSVPMFEVRGYQGANNPFRVWQDGRVEQYGTTGNVNYPLAVPTATSAVDSGAGSLAAGTYFYKITACNFVGETIGSNEVSVFVTANRQVTISWIAPNLLGVDHFRVYRATTSNGYTATSRIDGGTTGVPYYLLSFVDTGAAATSGTPPTSANFTTNTIRRWAGQTGAFFRFENEAGSVMSYILQDGSWLPPTLADSAATNGTIYYSSTQSKLVYKNGSGVVNVLY